MDIFKTTWLKKLLTVILAGLLSFSLVLSVACSADSGSTTSSSDDSSTEETEETVRADVQTVLNGDFEFLSDSVTNYIDTGIKNWSRSYDSITTSAVTPLYKSGIISVTEGEAYQSFAASNGFPKIGETDTYYNPSTPEKEGYEKDLFVYDENDEEKTNDDKLPSSGDHILVINNITSNGAGTAQKFTSSSTVTVDGYGKLSVWVLTKDLSSKMKNVPYGAYISITNSLGSSLSPLTIKNINTEGKWQRFDFYFEASDYATSTIKVVLGLGFGSAEYKAEYVNGLAFFDNVNYQTIDEAAYKAATALTEANNYTVYGETKNVDISRYIPDDDVFEDNLTIPTADYTKAEDLAVSYIDIKKGKDETETFTVNTISLSHKLPVYDFTLSGNGSFEANSVLANPPQSYNADTQTGVADYNAVTADKLSGVTNPLGNVETAYIIHNNGASTTLNVTSGEAANNGYFVVYDGTAQYITFLMKVKTEMSGQKGVTVKVLDKGSKKTACDNVVTVLSDVTTNDADEEKLEGWVRVNIYVSNFTGDKFDRYFTLAIDFGPTDTVDRYVELTEGYALFTGFAGTILNKDEYNVAEKSGSYSGSASLGAEIKNVKVEEEDSDEYAIKYAKSAESEIENTVVTSIVNYKGAIGGSKAVGGAKDNAEDEKVVAGVINSKYLDKYTELTAVKSDITALAQDPDEGNKNIQPIIIYNKEETSYGFISGNNTFSANSTTLVTVKMSVSGTAKANVYLTGTDPLKGFEILAIEGKAVNRDGNKPVYSTTKETAEVYRELIQTVEADDCNGKWITVKFLVKAGQNDIPYRVEIFNGSRDGEVLSQGLVVIDSVDTKTGVSIDEFRNETIAEYGSSDNDEVLSYQGVVKTVTYTDSDGFNAVKYTNDPSSVDVFTKLANANTIIASYENIDVATEVDESTAINNDASDEEEVDEEKEENYSLALQITSMIISIALIIVLLVLVFRTLFKKIKSDKEEIENNYDLSSREKVHLMNKAKREAAAKKKAEEDVSVEEDTAEEVEDHLAEDAPAEEETADETAEETADEEQPYDYENAENNIPKNPDNE